MTGSGGRSSNRRTGGDARFRPRNAFTCYWMPAFAGMTAERSLKSALRGTHRRPEPCNHHIKLLSDRRAEIDGLFHRPFTGRVYEFHILVFDPSHPASHSLTAQTTRGVQFPARRGGLPTRLAYERFRIDLLS